MQTIIREEITKLKPEIIDLLDVRDRRQIASRSEPQCPT